MDNPEIRLACYCGDPLYISAGRVTRCAKCGTGWRIEVAAKAFARHEDQWEPADTHCEGCGRGLLNEQVAVAFEDAALCAKCTKEIKEGKDE